jgi:cobalt-zinc-cadmium efflux system membrane fusion protein
MKTQLQLLKLLTLSIVVSTIVSCSNNSSKEKPQKKNKVQNNTVELSDEQFKNAEIVVGAIETKNLSSVIKVNGKLDVPPQNLVSITPPMAGFLKSTELLQGMKVNKGDVLAVLQNSEYIQLQQDYMESKSQLEFLEAEYKRQQVLAKENVSSEKILAQTKANYQSMFAKVGGLKSKLTLVGINLSQVESGNFQNTIIIHAPISGYVTQVHVNIGMFVNTTDVLFKIVDTKHLHAELTVFEKDIPKIKVGQKVRFTLANENTERTATVYLIGKEIEQDRTVRIHCHLSEEDAELLPGMYLKAFIETGIATVKALPNEAIVNYDGSDYIFAEQKTNSLSTHIFKMEEVKKGISELGYTEIILKDNLADASAIVVKGAFDLMAEMKNKEEE